MVFYTFKSRTVNIKRRGPKGATKTDGPYRSVNTQITLLVVSQIRTGNVLRMLGMTRLVSISPGKKEREFVNWLVELQVNSTSVY